MSYLPRPLPPGFEIGRYVVQRRLAMGGMAELYLARARGPFGFSKRCAIKFALQHLAEDPAFVSMFVHEARVLANLDHPNIAQVLDVGEFEGGPYFAMQYVEGRDLRQVMKALRGQPMDLPVALRIASRVAAGLAYAHARTDADGRPLGIVHRDVSPANVMLGYQGDVKLVDFGVAKSTAQDEATRRGVIKGKAAYLSPEQARGKPVDHRTDVFALGILLFETTTGRRLFRGDGDFELLRKIVEGDFPSPHDVCDDYPEQLAHIVMHALRVDPGERYQSAGAFRQDVEAFAREHNILASELDVAALMTSLFEAPSPDAAPEAADAVTPASPPEAFEDDEPSTSQTRVARAGTVRMPGPSTGETVVAASGSHTQVSETPVLEPSGTYNPRGTQNKILIATAIAVSALGLVWGVQSTRDPVVPAAQSPAPPEPRPVAAAPAPAAVVPSEPLPAPQAASETPVEPVSAPAEATPDPAPSKPIGRVRSARKKRQPRKKPKPRPRSKDRAGPDSMYP